MSGRDQSEALVAISRCAQAPHLGLAQSLKAALRHF
jgi:hypothetical protein